jgi:hypothetical protein
MSRELLFGEAGHKMPTERVPTPELGEGAVVIVRGMTGLERDAFQKSIISGRGRRSTVNMENITAKLVARCVINEDGSRSFTDSDEDIAKLGNLRGDVLNRIYDAAARLSGLSQADLEELGNE